MSYKRNISENSQRSAQERAANDLRGGLEKPLLTGREGAQRRWFRELLQNARDIEGVEYTGGRSFSHDGKGFNSEELSRLTEQDSSKRSEEGPGRPIGRFGIGFLTTHLLSRVVRVRGIVHDEGEPPKPVDVVLDRRGDTPKALRAGVDGAFSALDGFVCLDETVHADTIAALELDPDDTFVCLDTALTHKDRGRLLDKTTLFVI